MTKRDYCIVWSGSGTRIPCHGGAFEGISQAIRPVAVGGSSGGGILALAVASGMDASAVRKLCESMLTRNDLLDRSWWPLDRWGIYKGDAIYDLLTKTFGQKRMRDLTIPCRVVVCDLWTRRAVIVDSKNDPDVFVRDAARCTMAIPVFFRAALLHPDNARLYVDGGTVDNFPHGLWDDITTPTLGVRFADSDDETVRPVRDMHDYAAALFDLRQDAANKSDVSKKTGSTVLIIDTKSDSLKFGLSADEIQARWSDGKKSAERWLAGARL